MPLISSFVERAKAENCDLYCALYELNDPSLLDLLQANADRVHLILSTAGSTKPPKGSHGKVAWDTTNTQSRARLRNKVAEFHDRMFNNSAHIGHNKFVVLVDRTTHKAKAVLAGSTNWTFTGLCTQSNNVIIIEDEAVAGAYYDYWQRLRDDKLPVPKPISAPDSNKQGQKLRTADMKPNHSTLAADGKTDITLWYSPNTKAATKNKASPTPPDLADVFARMNNAKDAIFFLTFMPSVAGDQSIIVESLDVALKKNSAGARRHQRRPRAAGGARRGRHARQQSRDRQKGRRSQGQNRQAPERQAQNHQTQSRRHGRAQRRGAIGPRCASGEETHCHQARHAVQIGVEASAQFRCQIRGITQSRRIARKRTAATQTRHLSEPESAGRADDPRCGDR